MGWRELARQCGLASNTPPRCVRSPVCQCPVFNAFVHLVSGSSNRQRFSVQVRAPSSHARHVLPSRLCPACIITTAREHCRLTPRAVAARKARSCRAKSKRSCRASPSQASRARAAGPPHAPRLRCACSARLSLATSSRRAPARKVPHPELRKQRCNKLISNLIK